MLPSSVGARMGTLLLVRHGQASAFEDNYDRLSILGEKQARLLGETWRRRELKLDRIFTGPRVRQHRTAEIAAEAGGLPAPVVLPELDEMQVEPLFREHLPDLFARHAHLQVLGDAMLAALGSDDETALGLAFQVRNSSVSEFVFSAERFSLVSFNETPHLLDAALVTVR